jgi:hypothetical protein
MIQEFTFDGTGREINAHGSHFRYERAAAGGGPEGIRVQADGQDCGVLLPGDALDLPRPASRWIVRPVYQFMTGMVRVGVAAFSSDRVQGEVTTRTREYARADNHRAFVKAFFMDPTPAGVPQVQLWNPGGMAIIVQRVQSSNSGNLPVYVSASNVQANTATTPAMPEHARASKRNGEDLGGAQSRYTFPRPGAWVAPASGVLGVIRQPATELDLSTSGPLVIHGGWGLTVALAHAPGGLAWHLHMEWDEIPFNEL